MHAFLFGETEDPTANAAWDQFWGFDCVAKDGLCERAYNHLGLPETAWPGLKQLPQAKMLTISPECKMSYYGCADRLLSESALRRANAFRCPDQSCWQLAVLPSLVQGPASASTCSTAYMLYAEHLLWVNCVSAIQTADTWSGAS